MSHYNWVGGIHTRGIEVRKRWISTEVKKLTSNSKSNTKWEFSKRWMLVTVRFTILQTNVVVKRRWWDHSRYCLLVYSSRITRKLDKNISIIYVTQRSADNLKSDRQFRMVPNMTSKKVHFNSRQCEKKKLANFDYDARRVVSTDKKMFPKTIVLLALKCVTF